MYFVTKLEFNGKIIETFESSSVSFGETIGEVA
jgi:hypothetical protein